MISVIPKLPMREKNITREFYVNNLGFEEVGNSEKNANLLLKNNNVVIHFFELKELNLAKNYSQIFILTKDIDKLYNSILEKALKNSFIIGQMQLKSWGLREFKILDTDNNIITFGQNIDF